MGDSPEGKMGLGSLLKFAKDQMLPIGLLLSILIGTLFPAPGVWLSQQKVTTLAVVSRASPTSEGLPKTRACDHSRNAGRPQAFSLLEG